MQLINLNTASKNIALLLSCVLLYLINCLSASADSSPLADFYYDYFKQDCLDTGKEPFFFNAESSIVKVDLTLPDLAENSFNIDALKDLNKNASVSSDLKNYSKCQTLHFLTTEEIKNGFSNKPKFGISKGSTEKWAGFREIYPNSGGIINLSLPGFSNDGKTAVMVQDVVCGPTCGTERLIEYKRVGKFWIPDKTIELKLR